MAPGARTKSKRPATTLLVTEALEVVDDFLSFKDLVALTGDSPQRIHAALHWLVTAGAIAVVTQGEDLFYYRSIDTDRRTYAREETTEHTKPRRKNRIVKIKREENPDD
jgi:DNA-binding transcriptional regulator PaaX